MELQQFFIRIRDELCKNGEILLSPALSYTTKHLHSDVEKEKKEKLPKEMEEDKLKREEEKKGILSLSLNPYNSQFSALSAQQSVKIRNQISDNTAVIDTNRTDAGKECYYHYHEAMSNNTLHLH